jgi:hypothetical protein
VAAVVLVVAPAASASPGQRVTDAKDGFSLVLPPGWSEVSLNSSDIGAMLGNASKAGLKLNQAAISDAQGAAKQGLKFFAISSAIENGGAFYPNVNVGVYPGTLSQSLLDAQVKLELTQVGAKQIHTRVVHFPFGSAVEGTYALLSTQGTLHGAQIYVSHGGNTYIVTFSAADPGYLTKSVTKVMPTWRFTRH